MRKSRLRQPGPLAHGTGTPVEARKVPADQTPDPADQQRGTTLPIPGQRHQDPPADGEEAGQQRRARDFAARGRARKPERARREAAQRVQREALLLGGARRGEVRRGAGRRERRHAGSRGAGCGCRGHEAGEAGAAGRVPGSFPPRLGGGRCGTSVSPAGRWSAAPAHQTRRTPTWVSASQGLASFSSRGPAAVTGPGWDSHKGAVCTTGKPATPLCSSRGGPVSSVHSVLPRTVHLNVAHFSRMLVSLRGLLREGGRFCLLQHCAL